MVATLSTASEHGIFWNTAIEAQQQFAGTVFAHKYVNTTLTMNTTYTTFPNDIKYQGGVTSSQVYTNDGGRSWKVDTISVPQFTFSP